MAKWTRLNGGRTFNGTLRGTDYSVTMDDAGWWRVSYREAGRTHGFSGAWATATDAKVAAVDHARYRPDVPATG